MTIVKDKNLELQIKKSALELQILETDIRDYEIAPDQEPSLHQLSWCERNLNQSLQRVIARKLDLISSANKGKQVPVAENPNSSQVFRQNDPWTGPSSARARESMFNDFQRNENMFSTDLNRAPFHQSPSLHATSEHCMTDPPVFQYQDQNNAQAMKVLFSDSANMSTLDSSGIQLDPRPSTGMSTSNPSTSEVPRTVFDEMGMLTSDLMGQFRHMDKSEQAENTIFTYGDNAGDEYSVAYGTTSMDQQGPSSVTQQKEPSQVPPFDNSLLEETREDQSQWDMNQQKNNDRIESSIESEMAAASHLTILAPKPRSPQPFRAAASCSAVTPGGFKKQIMGVAAGILAASVVASAAPLEANATRIEYFATVAEPSCELNFVRSGLGYCDVVLGSGEEVPFAQLINVHYTARFDDGIVFDSTYKRARPLTMRLGMGKLAYGPEPAGCFSGDCNIPANATLVYDVHFVNVYSGNRKE
ncbi:hypothetical protein SASPL_153724 [Salvia splendens]|uniref:peptidylprolyl isomerase n=1 Tax=Salvia splendens TaxID=180675 RepID=A0A8X8YZ64_SALSN|nr:hypothetical protein SASPL_153724 [Salvia splendens]